MLLNYVLRIKINGQVVYVKDDFYKLICKQNTNVNSCNNNHPDYETLPSEEVMKHARKS